MKSSAAATAAVAAAMAAAGNKCRRLSVGNGDPVALAYTTTQTRTHPEHIFPPVKVVCT